MCVDILARAIVECEVYVTLLLQVHTLSLRQVVLSCERYDEIIIRQVEWHFLYTHNTRGKTKCPHSGQCQKFSK